MKTKTSMAVWSLAALLGFVLLAGCGKKEEEQPAAAPSAAAPAAATPIDPATPASISGTAKLEGEAPKPPRMDKPIEWKKLMTGEKLWWPGRGKSAPGCACSST